jgi:hypothetical protein
VKFESKGRFVEKKWIVAGAVVALVIGVSYGLLQRPKKAAQARHQQRTAVPARTMASLPENEYTVSEIADPFAGERVKAPAKNRQVFAAVPSSVLSSPEIMNRVGIPGRRAREIKIDTGLLLENQEAEREIKLNLFDDAAVTAVFFPSSALEVNHAFLSGAVAGDPSGQIALAVSQQGHVSGTIATKKAKYRIVASGNGSHYIVELKP